MQLADTAAQALDLGFDLDDISRINRPSEANPFNTSEERNSSAVLGLGQNQDCPDLCDALCEDRRRQRRQFSGLMCEIALVERNVLDSHDPLVRLEFGDAIHQQKRIAMREDALDNGVVQRQIQRIHR